MLWAGDDTMDIREAQELMYQIYYERDRARGMERAILRTFQELGELSDAILRHDSPETVGAEMADVFAWLCSLANLLGVDLSMVLLEKYGSGCSRCGKIPCECMNTP